MPFKLSRRELLLTATTGLVAVGLCRLSFWSKLNVLRGGRPDAGRHVDLVITLVRQRLDYLKVSDGDLASFARDFQARGDRHLKKLATDDPGEFADGLTVQFLMSTDFFLNGADESRAVTYRTYYDPHDGCSNPFAEFD